MLTPSPACTSCWSTSSPACTSCWSTIYLSICLYIYLTTRRAVHAPFGQVAVATRNHDSRIRESLHVSNAPATPDMDRRDRLRVLRRRGQTLSILYNRNTLWVCKRCLITRHTSWSSSVLSRSTRFLQTRLDPHPHHCRCRRSLRQSLFH
jgi:hypothetical protein